MQCIRASFIFSTTAGCASGTSILRQAGSANSSTLSHRKPEVTAKSLIVCRECRWNRTLKLSQNNERRVSRFLLLSVILEFSFCSSEDLRFSSNENPPVLS
jgi:hypothetical protein